ncbi:MAG: glycoside hydrolase family 3 N-terminal domain-containing protein [Melioribacteraceae bacterium]|nr:glycoside hydrolase family 3 N-terminal domain-containing protein [Melioribacteraceae bacterium]
MKYLISILFFYILAAPNYAILSSGVKGEKEIEKKVKSLLSRMTLEEKIGQMTQVTIQAVSKLQGTKDQHHELDLEKLEEAVVKYKVGSILNVYDVSHEIDYWHEVITKIQDLAINKTRLKIPVLYGIDAIHGATYTKGSTLFPQALAMASTFNRQLERISGEITSIETRASGIPWNFYPVLDIGRHPAWSRLWETFGEDVYLVSELGKAYIEGAQGSDYSLDSKTAICLKHYAGYSLPLTGKDRTPAWIGERMMREYFLEPFRVGIDAGAETIMINSSEVDGIPGHANYHLLTEVLKNEWKFKGFTVSDWEDINRLHTRDNVADSPEEAVRMAVMAGVDMSMVPYDFSFYEILLKLVKEGKVPIKRINEAVERILRVKFKSGIFENPYPVKSLSGSIGTDEHAQQNLQAARESIILVQNENNFLPLSKDIKLLVTGPTADKLMVLNGGWTITWQGNEESLYPQDKFTVLEAIESKIGKSNVTFVPGSDFSNLLDIEKAVSAANKSDAILLCLGETPYCETPGNITDLTLDLAQLELAKKIIDTGKPVILLLIEGRPRIINPIVPGVKSILVSFLPGMEGGRAVADILFGDANPSARLPITYPRFVNDFTLYDHKQIEAKEGNSYNPQWEFGHGLSYTTFQYSDLTISKDIITRGENLSVKVNIKNTGDIKGSEAVLMFISDLYRSVSPPVKQLKGFEKIELTPGQTRTVEFIITPEHLSFYGIDFKKNVEPGKFVVSIGKLKKEFTLK